ncbi:MAG: sugar ABC transporter permease [Oscillospiraceae bacterium]|nr:sugar ABC transporter permease [Oscillospiraceae bacterium]
MANATTKPRKMISYAKYGYIFIAPFFIIYALFMFYPLLNTVRLSFFGNAGNEAANLDTFVGLQNYQYILFGGDSVFAQQNHETFLTSFGNTLILWVGNFVVQIILSLLLAVWFSDVRIKTPGTGFFKVIMYLPNIIMAASVAGIFLMIFNDSQYGAINSILLNAGLIQEPILFVSDVWSSRIIVMLIQTWMWFGNTMLLLMSGIFGIDPSIYEAAAIDGSSGPNTFFRITLPILKPIFFYVVITSLIGGLQMFDIPYMLHNGNALNVNNSLRTVAVFVYEKFTIGGIKNYGLSAAASVILFIITVVLGMLINKFNTDSTAPKKKRKKG